MEAYIVVLPQPGKYSPILFWYNLIYMFYLLGRIRWCAMIVSRGFSRSFVKLLYCVTYSGTLNCSCFVLWIYQVKTCTLQFLFTWQHFKSFLSSIKSAFFCWSLPPVLCWNCRSDEPQTSSMRLWKSATPKLRFKIFQEQHFKVSIRSISGKSFLHAHPIQATKHSNTFRLLTFFCNISWFFGSPTTLGVVGTALGTVFVKRHRGLSTRPGASRFSMRAWQVLCEVIQSDDH